MIRTYSQMHRTDKYSQHSSIIRPAWLNGWAFVYKLLSGFGFEFRCSHDKSIYRYFLEANFVGVNRLFVLAYTNEAEDFKRFKTQRHYLSKDIIKKYNVIINGKNLYDEPTDSDVKRYEETRKLTTGQGEDCTTGCLFDYDYIKSYYRLITVDLSR